jgi:hypothetical protein
MNLNERIFDLLTGQKIYSDGKWRVYGEDGTELADPGGVLWRATPGALIMWPRVPGVFPPPPPPPPPPAPDGVGPDDFIFNRDSRIARRDSEWETFVPADVLALRRLAEDEILLVMIARAVTSGALNQWH